MNKSIEQDYEFRVATSDFSDIVGKVLFTQDMTFVKCLSGSAVIIIDSTEHTLAARHSFVLAEHITVQVKSTSADFAVTCISISLPFFYEIVAGFDSTIFNVLLHNSVPEMYKSTDLKAANLLFESLCLLHNNPQHSNRRQFAMNLISCYVYEMYELTLPHVDAEKTKGSNNPFTSAIISFYNLVASYGHQCRNIEFYAEKLNMSSRYLYKIVQCSCRTTPKQLIDDVVVSLIKQALLTTSLNNQQIADRFCFSDQSAFGQYFKRCTGLSPSSFRNKHHR